MNKTKKIFIIDSIVMYLMLIMIIYNLNVESLLQGIFSYTPNFSTTLLSIYYIIIFIRSFVSAFLFFENKDTIMKNIKNRWNIISIFTALYSLLFIIMGILLFRLGIIIVVTGIVFWFLYWINMNNINKIFILINAIITPICIYHSYMFFISSTFG
jgi:membrane protease YdiL (CAAX protease family)